MLARIVLALPLLVILPLFACAPEVPLATHAGAIGQTSTDSAVVPVKVNPVVEAERLLGERFEHTSWTASIVSVELAQNGMLRVSLDRTTNTLGEAEVFTKMCSALTGLIAAESNPGGVKGVQFFRADGTPVVASGQAGVPCKRFYL